MPARYRNTRRLSRRNKTYALVIIICVGSLLVVLGLIPLINRYRATSGTAPTLTGNSVVTRDTKNPSEIVPEQEYSVPWSHPRQIIMPTLGIDGFVQQVGINRARQIVVPTNIHVAGWYNASELPGSSGLSIIDGHVSGRYADGIFKYLDRLRPGDTIRIEYGDLQTKKFEVVDSTPIPEELSVVYLFTKRPDIVSQLNLITCTGSFDSAKRSYTKRLIVVTKLVTSNTATDSR